MIVLPSSGCMLAPLLSEYAFRIGGMQIEIVSFYCHLGHMIYSSLSDEQDISYRRNTFIGQVNSVCFFAKLPSAVKAWLFLSYCTSYYGCVLWDLSCSVVGNFCIAWRKSIRRIWNLPYQAHLLSLLCGCLPVYHEICLRSVNFVRSCITHFNTLVKFIARYSIFYGQFSSPAARSMLYCAQRYSCAVEDLLFTCSTCNVVDSCVCERFTMNRYKQLAYCKNV